MLRFFAIPAALILLASCKETAYTGVDLEPKKIDTSVVRDTSKIEDPAFRAYDTAYKLDAETPQQRVVLIEEFTGVTCPQCPGGHATLKAIHDKYPGRVAIIGIQPFGVAQANPFDHDGAKTKYDNRTQAGSSVGSLIYGGILALPQAGFDRISDPGPQASLFGRGEWASRTDTRLALPTKVNMAVRTVYDSVKGRVAIKVRVAFTGDMSIPQNLTVAITEDEVIDVQENAIGYTADYHHQHVLRDILTKPAGDAILAGTNSILSGQVAERTFVYTLPTDKGWNPANCHVIAFVSNNNGANQEVTQAVEQTLKK